MKYLRDIRAIYLRRCKVYNQIMYDLTLEALWQKIISTNVLMNRVRLRIMASNMLNGPNDEESWVVFLYFLKKAALIILLDRVLTRLASSTPLYVRYQVSVHETFRYYRFPMFHSHVHNSCRIRVYLSNKSFL